jgi:hypothetical protein
MDKEDKDNPPYIEHVVAIFRDAASQIEKELSLECIGSGGAMPRDVERIDLDFIAYQRATVEQARELEVEATEKLVKIINAHEKIRPFLRESPFPASRTGVSISFCKKNNCRYMDGSVAYVFQAKNIVYYDAWHEKPNSPCLYPITDGTLRRGIQNCSGKCSKKSSASHCSAKKVNFRISLELNQLAKS